MKPETWPRVRSVFEAALDVEPERRDEFLIRECGADAGLLAEVRAMLRADAGALRAGRLVEGDPGAALAADDLVGATVGGFTVVRRIGAGGMGVVYEARQQRLQRPVALKALAVRFPSERVRRRFEDEAAILARLRHAAIAQVLEAGTARVGDADVPWFAMDLVDTPQTLDRHVRERGLDARAVVALCVTVCDAVHYAHQRGVIHRDLKPANVLVDVHGRPKVIDFGIARLADRDAASRFTRTGEILGTLAYMSPERLERGDQDDATTADVYALGVILYELLAGRSPYPLDGLPPARAVELLRAADPPPLADGGRIPAELDWIARKAMARDPRRRYASVAELQQDLERFLRHEPVQAAAPSTTYRLRKLAWRHRVLLGVATAGFAATSIGLVIALLGWRRVAAAERVASRKAAVLEEVNRFQQEVLKGAEGSGKGRELRLAEVLDTAAVALEERGFTDPIVEVGARNSLGMSYVNLGLVPEAEQQFLRARALLEQHGIGRHEGWGIPVSSNLARIYEQQGKLELAVREMRTVLADDLAARGPEHDDVAVDRSNLANALVKQGAHAEALELATQARAGFTRRHGAHSRQALNASGIMALALAEMGRLEDAQRGYEATLALADLHLDRDDTTRLAILTGYAGVLHRQKRLAEYARVCEHMASARERISGPTHHATWTAWGNLAVAQSELGRHAEAEATLRRTAAAMAQLGIRDGYAWVVNQQNLTVAIRRQGRTAEAEALAREQRETATRSLPQDHWLLGVVTKEQGACLRELGRMEEAEPLLLAAHELLARVVGEKDFRAQKVVSELVALYEAWQRPRERELWAARRVPEK